jgi:long-chain fatty acid transport protein
MSRARLLLVLLLAPGTARASGFLLYEQSAPAIARGSAVVAASDDPSAAFYNPAALTQQGCYGALVSSAVVFPGTRFTAAADGAVTSSQSRPAVVPSLFLQGALTERVHVGLGVFAPFGLYVKWPDGWVGAQQSLKTDLAVLAVNPSIAVRLHERLSIAAGASVVRGFVTLGLEPVAHAPAELKGSAWGWGANVAVLWRPLPERLHVGATYRSQTRLPFHGDARFTPPPGLEMVFVNQRATATIQLPDVVALGVSAHPLPRLELDAEIDWVRWSTFKELHIAFEKGGTPDIRIQRSSVEPLSFRAGGAWQWTPHWTTRAGASFDESASRQDTLAPSAPDARRLSVAIGGGWRSGKLTLDVAYLYAHFFAAHAVGPNARPEGTYRTRAHALAISIGFVAR